MEVAHLAAIPSSQYPLKNWSAFKRKIKPKIKTKQNSSWKTILLIQCFILHMRTLRPTEVH